MLESPNTLHANPAPMTIVEAIVAHSHAVQLDEACFNDAGELIVGTQAESDARLAVCNALLRQVAEAPCRHAADVQVKVDYLLNGTVGNRPQNIDVITGFDEGEELNAEGGPLKTFLRSLLIEPKLSDLAKSLDKAT